MVIAVFPQYSWLLQIGLYMRSTFSIMFSMPAGSGSPIYSPVPLPINLRASEDVLYAHSSFMFAPPSQTNFLNPTDPLASRLTHNGNGFNLRGRMNLILLDLFAFHDLVFNFGFVFSFFPSNSHVLLNDLIFS
jgi:hypothetical protein